MRHDSIIHSLRFVGRPTVTRGFAVPMAASIAIVVGLLMTGALEFARLQTAGLSSMRDRTEAQAPLRSAVNLFTLLLSTSAIEGEGITIDLTVWRPLAELRDSRLHLDGTPFEATVSGRQMRVRIQDEAGLLPINGLSLAEFEAVLRSQGVDGDRARQFAAEVIDFRDIDQDRTPGGAERADYVRRNLRLPKDRAFNHSGELGLLLSAAELQRSVHGHTVALFGFEPSGMLNINSATPESLRIAFGFSASEIDRLIRDRRENKSVSASLTDYGLRQTSDLPKRLFWGHSNRFRIIIEDIKSGAFMKRVVALQPRASVSPLIRSNNTGREATRQLPMIDRETVDLPK